MAITSSTSARRGSAATDVTMANNARMSLDTAPELSNKGVKFDDDEKTLANFPLNEDSPDDSKTTKPNSMPKDKKPKKKPLPPNYYPSLSFTLMAINSSRI
ncbi:hypothetical protein GGR50DRAFT_544840 [Xylaria sp. CBS 124048]|nr:hypothetical protein GGR50DRAFT_544840 [Xylaria sp. CBS 124048]